MKNTFNDDMNPLDTTEEMPVYEPPMAVIYDLKVELAFLGQSGSAYGGGFGDPGGW